MQFSCLILPVLFMFNFVLFSNAGGHGTILIKKGGKRGKGDIIIIEGGGKGEEKEEEDVSYKYEYKYIPVPMYMPKKKTPVFIKVPQQMPIKSMPIQAIEAQYIEAMTAKGPSSMSQPIHGQFVESMISKAPPHMISQPIQAQYIEAMQLGKGGGGYQTLPIDKMSGGGADWWRSK